MEARKEAIRIAYGNDWETVKDYVDENGWIKDGKYHNGQPIDFEIMEIDWECLNDEFQSIIRPITLKGIENNNGWVKIESENDLPKKQNNLWVLYDDGSIVLGSYNIFSGIFETRLSKIAKDSEITHIMWIDPPKKPIY